MCLSVVDEKPIVKEGIGWKVFEKLEGELTNWYYGAYFYKFNINEWNTDKTRPIISTLYVNYPSGFHIHKTRKSARIQKGQLHVITPNYVIKKVKFRNVVATGYEGFNRVIVAREILILPDKV